MPAGRPRTLSFTPEEMVELGKEMLEWLENAEDLVHLSDWYTLHKKFTYNEWKSFIQRAEFLPYYENALKIVGRVYLKKDSPVEPSLKQRWQRVYYKDLREQEDQDKDDDIKRQTQLATATTVEYEDKLMRIAAQLEAARAQFSNKKVETNDSV